MKKKILLTTIMMAVLVFILAVSAFAVTVVSETTSEEYGTIKQLDSDPGLDDAKNYVSTLKKINDAGTDNDALCILTDGTYYYVFPSSYIVNERADGKFDLAVTDLTTAMTAFNDATDGKDYYASYTVNGSGAAKHIDSMVRFEFTSDVTSVSDSLCCLRYYPSLVEVRFKYAINLSAGDLFRDSKALKTVVGYEKATSMGNSAFMGCSSLESVCLPVNTTRIPSKAFWGCKKVTITNLAELTQLTTIGSSAFQDTSYLNFVLPDTVTTIEANAFQSAFKEGSGGSFVINETSQLTTIGNSAFEDCRMMPASIYIPSTVTSIGTKAFLKCYTLQTLENFENCQITTIEDGTFSSITALKSIKIPETVTTIGTAFAGNNNLQLVYIPRSVTSIADTFTGNPTNAVFIYTGTDASVLSACTKIAGANVINASKYDADATYTGINLVVGYSHCVAYNNGNHAEAVLDSIEISTYFEPITLHNKCANCTMAADDTQIPALFICLGYSAPKGERNGIVIGFAVDNDAVAQYAEVSGTTVAYGVFAAAESKLGSGDVFSTSGAITTDLTGYGFASFDLRILGFADEQMNLTLAMGAYVAVTDEEGTTYSYLQSGTPKAGEKYCFVSYNSVMQSISNNQEEE